MVLFYNLHFYTYYPIYHGGTYITLKIVKIVYWSPYVRSQWVPRRRSIKWSSHRGRNPRMRQEFPDRARSPRLKWRLSVRETEGTSQCKRLLEVTSRPLPLGRRKKRACRNRVDSKRSLETTPDLRNSGTDVNVYEEFVALYTIFVLGVDDKYLL